MDTIDKYFSEFDGAEVVNEFFGFFPSLHDSEVIEIKLDRELGFDLKGPTLYLTLYAFDYRCQPDDPERKDCKINLIFEGIELDYLRYFNHQNAMADFNIERYYSDRLKCDRYRIEFGEFGGQMGFTCRTVKVDSIAPFKPIDYFEKKE